ncbi:bacterio-opsin activator [Caldimicrobium thiodismutans]|uniref:Bacterio-opsin activator n=1 Tax=Caldimicrobium thiodismutans TaxID=1653476 RepID=A0A0U4W1M7_9BACT|nr:bacterio-opsin activator [Caldimicrobium thiodismutans]BAU23037.1 bacterio-opsin activator [Caldimicrobium thiodismutans]
MVIRLEAPPVYEQEIEQMVTRVFFKAIELLGGLSKLAEFRTLTWLPSLARAASAVVLKEEYMKSDEEIAQKIGLTKNTVKNILRADPELALQKIKSLEELASEETKDLKVHTAGGIAKLAYKEIKEGHEAQTLLYYCSLVASEVAKALDVPWAYQILKRTKGIKYPIFSKEDLKERLAGLSIKGNPIEEILSSLHYPLKTPALLIHEIKEYLLMKEQA